MAEVGEYGREEEAQWSLLGEEFRFLFTEMYS